MEQGPREVEHPFGELKQYIFAKVGQETICNHVVMFFLTFGMFGLVFPVIAVPGAAYTSAENVLVHYLRP